MWAKLTYRFEGMTEMINGAFMDDLGDLLSSITGQQRKTLYESDQEFEEMCEMLLKNFVTIKSLMPFLRSSLWQTMIRKLIKAHDGLDAKYLREVNRTLARTLHDAVFPGGPETIATTRLRSILKTPLAAKIIAGDVVGKENLWCTRPWLMESAQMWAKLIYRFEGMTEMINGAFMDDLGDFLSSITGQ